MDKVLDSLVKSIEDLLAKKNMSQTDLASALGISRQSVSQMLNLRRAPNIATIIEVARALEVPAFYLLMTPEERALWDAKAAQNDPKARLQEMVDRLPPELQEMGLAALEMIVNSHARNSHPAKKKA